MITLINADDIIKNQRNLGEEKKSTFYISNLQDSDHSHLTTVET